MRRIDAKRGFKRSQTGDALEPDLVRLELLNYVTHPLLIRALGIMGIQPLTNVKSLGRQGIMSWP